jgi:protein-tyrosine phosphatase
MITTNRIIKFDGAKNFRDIGGLETVSGHPMKQGVLFRSDALHKLTKRDARKIEDLNIKLICDLRTPNERKGKLDRLQYRSAIRRVNIPLYPFPLRQDPGVYARMMSFLFGKYKGIDLALFMRENYLRVALEHPREINGIITLLSDGNNVPAIIHCAGGKDRTGWLSFLLQSLAGVPQERMFEDYLLSNDFLLRDLKKTDRTIKWLTFFQFDLNTMRPMLEARADYLKNTIGVVLEKHGTIEAYLTNVCGISHETLHRMRELLLKEKW